MHATAGTGRPTLARRLVIIVSAIAMAIGLTSLPAQGAEPDNRGLFGSQDPTYDGVDRQSTAILGLIAVGAKVPRISIDWLLRQQCDDGSFAAFREDTEIPCSPPDLATYTGPNTNSTALAAMALAGLGDRPSAMQRPARQAARKAVTWLVSQQQANGGWEWLAGLGSDSTSTAMSLAAISKPRSTAHRKGIAFLKTAMPAGMGCGLAFSPESPVVDPLSTSWALLATQGALPYPHYRGPRRVTECKAARVTVRATASWLTSELTTGNGQIPSAFEPGQTDWNVTALATLGMTQRHGSAKAMRLGLSALKANIDAYVVVDDADRAAPLGTLLMVAHASKSDPRKFGGVDLIRRLLLTVQR
jgi:hypothetical protein